MTALTLSQDDLDQLEHLIETRAGIVFNEKNRPLLSDVVTTAMKASHTRSPEEFLAKILDPHETSTLEAVVSALTPGETYFFRNRPHFDVLEKCILPELIKRRSGAKCLRIWSAGCSTGEEAYSIAILLHRVIEDIDKWNITVLGTDINIDALSAARRAVYSAWSFRGSNEDFKTRYFDGTEGGWRLKDYLRCMVTFSSHNLTTDPYPSYQTNTAAMDVIFCRNVTIYFNKTVTRQITSRFYDALVDGGWLFAGHAESSDFIDSRFLTTAFPDAVAHQKQISRDQVTSAGFVLAGHGKRCGTTRQSLQQQGAMTSHDVERVGLKPREDAPADAAGTHAGLAPARVLLQEARRALETGDLTDARRLAQQAAGKNTLSAEAHYILGVVCDKGTDREGALAHLRRCLCIDRSFLPGHLAMAEVLLGLGRTHEARRVLQNVMGSIRDAGSSRGLSRKLREIPVSIRERALMLLSRCPWTRDDCGGGDGST